MIARTEMLSSFEEYMDAEYTTSESEDLVEFAGRVCYQSFKKPNPLTRSNKDYLANILAQGHESVLEHASVSFYVQGVSRNMLLELERHRHLSFSVISTRFVDSSKMRVVVPPAMRASLKDFPAFDGVTIPLDSDEIERYSTMVEALQSVGLTRKEAREAARWQLPGNLETKFVVTGNMRAWRDVLKKRYHVAADAEIREFATEILRQLREESPNIFQDFPNTPFE